jgi:MFS family permease
LSLDLRATRARAGAVRRLALAGLISLAGTDASGVAFSFALFAQTHSTIWLAAGMLVSFGLGSVLAPLGGAVADRAPRKALMVGADLVSATSFATLLLWHTPWALLSVSVVSTAAGLVFGPAANAAIPNLAGEDQLARANALIATGGNVGKAVGRLGAGALVGLCGFAVVFALNAVSFLVSAALILSIHGQFEAEGRRDRRPRETSAWRVWALPLQHPILRPLVLCSCVATFATSFSMTAETVLVFHFHAGALGLGALASCWALGMVAGSWYSGRALHADNEASGLFYGRVVMGCALGCVGLMPIFWPTLLCYVAGGAAGGFLLVAAQSLMQRHTDDDTRGRVSAAADALRTAAFGIGVLCAAFGVSAVGPRSTYVLVGIGVVASSAAAFRVVRQTGGLRPIRPAAQAS